MKTIETAVAEQATGCAESNGGLGKFYWDGDTVEVPNAGAGSYRRVFAKMGFDKVEVFDWTSSAGDLSFAVFDGYSWHPAWQSNRYPHHGFRYSVESELGFESKEACFNYMAA